MCVLKVILLPQLPLLPHLHQALLVPQVLQLILLNLVIHMSLVQQCSSNHRVRVLRER